MDKALIWVVYGFVCMSVGYVAGWQMHKPHYEPHVEPKRDGKGRFTKSMPEQTRDGDR